MTEPAPPRPPPASSTNQQPSRAAADGGEAAREAPAGRGGAQPRRPAPKGKAAPPQRESPGRSLDGLAAASSGGRAAGGLRPGGSVGLEGPSGSQEPLPPPAPQARDPRPHSLTEEEEEEQEGEGAPRAAGGGVHGERSGRAGEDRERLSDAARSASAGAAFTFGGGGRGGAPGRPMASTPREAATGRLARRFWRPRRRRPPAEGGEPAPPVFFAEGSGGAALSRGLPEGRGWPWLTEISPPPFSDVTRDYKGGGLPRAHVVPPSPMGSSAELWKKTGGVQPLPVQVGDLMLAVTARGSRLVPRRGQRGHGMGDHRGIPGLV